MPRRQCSCVCVCVRARAPVALYTLAGEHHGQNSGSLFVSF